MTQQRCHSVLCGFFLLKYSLHFHLNISDEDLSCLYLGALGGVLEDDLL